MWNWIKVSEALPVAGKAFMLLKNGLQLKIILPENLWLDTPFLHTYIATEKVTHWCEIVYPEAINDPA